MKLLRNTLYSGIEVFLLVVSGLILTPVLINSIGTVQFGAFVFLSLISFTGMLSFLDFGMEGALINKISTFKSLKDNTLVRKVCFSGLIFYLIFALFVLFLVFAFDPFIVNKLVELKIQEQSAINSLFFVKLIVFFQFLSKAISAFLEGFQRYDILKLTSSFFILLQTILIIYLSLKNPSLEIIFKIIAIVTITRLSLLLLFSIFKENYSIYPHFDKEIWKSLIGFSLILFLSRLVGLIYNNSDKLIIFLLSNLSVLAGFDIANRFQNLLRNIVSVGVSALIPHIAERANDKNFNVHKEFITVTKSIFIILSPVSIILLIHAEMIIKLWVGAGFEDYSIFVSLFVVVLLINIPSSVISTFVVGLTKVSETIWIPVACSISRLILGIVLFNFIGLFGLLYAAIVCELIMCFFYVQWLFKSNFTISIFRTKSFYLFVIVNMIFILFNIVILNMSNLSLKLVLIFAAIIFTYTAYFIFILKQREKTTLMSIFRNVH